MELLARPRICHRTRSILDCVQLKVKAQFVLVLSVCKGLQAHSWEQGLQDSNLYRKLSL